MIMWEPTHTETPLERIAVAMERQADQADKILEHWAAQHEREEMLAEWRKKDRAQQAKDRLAAIARAERDDEFAAEQRAALVEQRALLALHHEAALDALGRYRGDPSEAKS
jgi:hypothetical protein